MNRAIKMLAGVAVCGVCSAVAIEGYAPTLTTVYSAEHVETGRLFAWDTAMSLNEDSVFIVGGLTFDGTVCPDLYLPYVGANIYGYEVWFTFQAHSDGTNLNYSEFPYLSSCPVFEPEPTDDHTALTVASGSGGDYGEVWVGGFKRRHTGGGGGGPMRPVGIGPGIGRGIGRGGRIGGVEQDDVPALPFPSVIEEIFASESRTIDGLEKAYVIRYALKSGNKLARDNPDNTWSSSRTGKSLVVDVVAGDANYVYAMVQYNPGGGDSGDVEIVKLQATGSNTLVEEWSQEVATSGTQTGVGLAYYNGNVYYLARTVPVSGEVQFQAGTLSASSGSISGEFTWNTGNACYPIDLDVDDSGGTYDGYAYLTGYEETGLGNTLDDFITIRMSTSGRDTGWTKYYDGGKTHILTSNERPVGVRVDGIGDVWVGGYGQVNDSNWDVDLDFVAVKYDVSANSEIVYYEDFGGSDTPVSVGIDGNDNFHIAGWRIVSSEKTMIIAHWESGGTKTTGEDSTGTAYVSKSAVDPTSGDVYLIGFDHDTFTFKYYLRMINFDYDGVSPMTLKN